MTNQGGFGNPQSFFVQNDGLCGCYATWDVIGINGQAPDSISIDIGSGDGNYVVQGFVLPLPYTVGQSMVIRMNGLNWNKVYGWDLHVHYPGMPPLDYVPEVGPTFSTPQAPFGPEFTNVGTLHYDQPSGLAIIDHLQWNPGNGPQGIILQYIDVARDSAFSNIDFGFQVSPTAIGVQVRWPALPGETWWLRVNEQLGNENAIGYWIPTSQQLRVLIPTSGGSPAGDPLMALDIPPQGNVVQPFTVAGWALDRGGIVGTGVDMVNVFAYPSDSGGNLTGAPYVPLGAAVYGDARPDVAAAFGDARFTNSGYHLQATGLPTGYFFLVVWAHSVVTNTWFAATQIVQVTGQNTKHVGDNLNVHADFSYEGPAANLTFTLTVVNHGTAVGFSQDAHVQAPNSPSFTQLQSDWVMGISNAFTPGVWDAYLTLVDDASGGTLFHNVYPSGWVIQ